MTEPVSTNPMPRAECESLARDVLARITAALEGVKALVQVRSSTHGTARFALNDMLDLSGTARVQIDLAIEIKGRRASATTDQRNPQGLAALIDALRTTEDNHGDPGRMILQKPAEFTDPPIYFESTLQARAPETLGDLVQRVTEVVEMERMSSAGSLSVRAESHIVMNTAGVNGYSRSTYCDFDVNARTASGKGSGWAWGGHEDFSRVDPLEVTQRAIDIARRSDEPVAVEPGRYVVILEPEAVAQLLDMPVFGSGSQYITLEGANRGLSVFSRFENKKVVGNKLGLRMADRRVQLFFDPMSKVIPFSPLDSTGRVLKRTYWIEDGVLVNLARADLVNPERGELQVDGPKRTLEEMIAGTRRGIWVHRFSSLAIQSPFTLLLTGVTRDGTFLIENGRVTKAIKNLRFSESPFFILNKIEEAGPVLRADSSIACPRLKVRDFEFTALSDAI